MEDKLTLTYGVCAACHAQALLAPTTADCTCLVCEQCALDANEPARRLDGPGGIGVRYSRFSNL